MAREEVVRILRDVWGSPRNFAEKIRRGTTTPEIEVSKLLEALKNRHVSGGFSTNLAEVKKIAVAEGHLPARPAEWAATMLHRALDAAKTEFERLEKPLELKKPASEPFEKPSQTKEIVLTEVVEEAPPMDKELAEVWKEVDKIVKGMREQGPEVAEKVYSLVRGKHFAQMSEVAFKHAAAVAKSDKEFPLLKTRFLDALKHAYDTVVASGKMPPEDFLKALETNPRKVIELALKAHEKAKKK